MDNELDNASEMPADLPWQLLEEITNGFSKEQRIGSGGYGVVYKGVYKNGEEIAVKKLYHMPGLDDKQFQNELQSLTRLRHQNIVRLVGKSYEEKERFGEYEGKLVCAKMIDRVICLEYLHNGSLEKHLSDESSGLPWHKRYKIIKGICDGLKYLHECGIFHLDLKPANILLDKNMKPKIADFGLSRLFSSTDQSHTTRNFIGTRRYAPPEYIEKGKISNKFDVFSLGVIIIGIMTGPDGYSKQSDMSSEDIVEQVLENWRNRPQNIMDTDRHNFDVFCQVRICIKIALNCVETDRHKRPSIGDIICKLNESETMIEKSYKFLPLEFCSTMDVHPTEPRISVNILDDVAAKISNVKRNKEKSTEPLIFQSSTTPMNIPLHIIESSTNGFSDQKKVGSGGYGDVYKGVYNGKEIAVKKLHQMPGLDEDLFRNEFNSLNTVQHPNIVRLVGYCYETRHKNVEYNGKFVFCEHIYRVLCFEYLPGGSLDKHISEESCGLEWCTRYKIIKGICEGLNYLHGWEKPIFHLDLKSGNILLDNNMVPKIADFGLSRLFAGTCTHQTQTLIGTIPYMPPEYINGGFVSNKNDVFSLGVIIIEIMTGRQGYSKFHETPTQEFIDLVHMNWRNRIEATTGYRSAELDQVEACIKTAIRCVDNNRNNRPTIADIVDKLNNTQFSQ